MSSSFLPAKRERVGLSIALAGASGSGKTKSALELATGLAGPGGRVAMIDTEGRRGLHYAGAYQFDHCDFAPPYTPEAFAARIEEAQKVGYDVVIVDSFSDEYEGQGGLQDIHDDEARRMATDRDGHVVEWKIEAMSAPAWRVPKTRHKASVIRRLRSYPGFVIFCLRAEEKVRFEKTRDERNGRERTVIVPAGWIPICEKRLMYDMSLSFTLVPGDLRGKPQYDLTCKVPDDFVPFFPKDQFIGRRAGEMLRAWATGAPIPEPATRDRPAQQVSTPRQQQANPPAGGPPGPEPPPPDGSKPAAQPATTGGQAPATQPEQKSGDAPAQQGGAQPAGKASREMRELVTFKGVKDWLTWAKGWMLEATREEAVAFKKKYEAAMARAKEISPDAYNELLDLHGSAERGAFEKQGGLL